jgi:squalene synthase HpnC
MNKTLQTKQFTDRLVINSNKLAHAVNHYENFPVASWLCPPKLRAPISAIYHFARTADDLADEGDAVMQSRLSDLSQYRTDLLSVSIGQPHGGRWPDVFEPLSNMMTQFQLPVHLLQNLLTAFEQDIRYTAQQRRYASDDELLDYCKLSANPVGRLLLHLYGINDGVSLAQSDQICTALQLINFWQDISVDVARSRWYPSQQTMAQFGVTDADLQADSNSNSATQLIASYAGSARAMILNGSQLCERIPGRAGWELRLVVQGGLRILDKMDAMNHATWRTRPKLSARDVPVMLWRALWMRGAKASAPCSR